MIRTTEQDTMKAEACPAGSLGDLIVPEVGHKPPLSTEPHYDRRAGGVTWRAGALIVTGIMGGAFAFAVGLKVHPTIASALAIAVLGVIVWQSNKR